MVKNLYLTAFSLLSGIALLGGCGGGGSGGSNTPKQAAQNLGNQIKEQVTGARDQFELAGNWDSACYAPNPAAKVPVIKDIFFKDFKSKKEEYHFSSNKRDFVKKTFYFDDSNCTKTAFVVEESGTIDPKGDSSPKDGLPLNFNFQNVKLKVQESTAAKILSGINYCGISTWQSGGDAVDITAQSNENNKGGGCAMIKGAPRTAYDYTKLEGNNLFLGGNALETQPDKRPQDVDRSPEKTLTKQPE